MDPLKIKLTVKDNSKKEDEILDLAGSVYDGLTKEEVESLEKTILTRNTFWPKSRNKRRKKSEY